jgi:uncharacterized membrane protein YdbT with pleckstrin-like domain
MDLLELVDQVVFMLEETGFDWVSLDPEEEILWSGEPRIQSIIPAIIVGIPMTAVLIGPLVIIAAYLNIKNTDFVVTNQGLYKKTGVLSRNVQKIGFDKVQNISFSQGALGNYFGYGNVEVSTAGGSGVEMRFNSIEDPKTVQELINKQIKQDEGKGRVGKAKDEVMKKMLNEMKKTRKAVEEIRDKMN